MNKSKKPLTKKRAIINYSLNVLFIFVVAFIFAFILYGRHFPVKALLLTSGFFLILFIVVGAIMYRRRFILKRPQKKRSKKTYYQLYIIFGALILLIYLVLFFIKGLKSSDYLNISVGFIFLILGIIKLRRIKKDIIK